MADTMAAEMNGATLKSAALADPIIGTMPKSIGHIPDMVHMADVAVTTGLAKLVSVSLHNYSTLPHNFVALEAGRPAG